MANDETNDNSSYCRQTGSDLCYRVSVHLKSTNLKIHHFLTFFHLQEQRLRYLQQGGRSNQGQTQVGSCLTSTNLKEFVFPHTVLK